MLAQKRELSRNYIGILSDALEEQREAVPPEKSDRPVRKYILGLVATVLHRGDDTR